VAEAPSRTRAEDGDGAGQRSFPRRLVDRAEHLADKIPGLHRFVSDLAGVEVFDRSVVIAAQALLGLVPLLIVLVAFLPPELAEVIVTRFESATGIDAGTPVVRTSLTTDEVREATGWVGLAIALLSVTSFAGALQRMLEHVWLLPHRKGLSMRLRGLVWFAGWLSALQVSSLLERLLDRLLGAPLLQLVTQGTTSTLVWWWTMYMLLVGRVRWAMTAPAAVLIGLATAVYSLTSDIWMPRYVVGSIAQFGALGLFLTVASWLIGFALIVTVCAVLGHAYVSSPSGEARVHRGLLRRKPASPQAP
jgi:membrane protein